MCNFCVTVCRVGSVVGNKYILHFYITIRRSSFKTSDYLIAFINFIEWGDILKIWQWFVGLYTFYIIHYEDIFRFILRDKLVCNCFVCIAQLAKNLTISKWYKMVCGALYILHNMKIYYDLFYMTSWRAFVLYVLVNLLKTLLFWDDSKFY